MDTKHAESVDEYIKAFPKDVRAALQKLRKSIKSAAPTAEEMISYRVPVYKLNGALVGFAAFSKHCSLFVMSPKIMPKLIGELKGYKYSGATVHFTPEKPLPEALVKKIVKARAEENQARAEKTKKTKAVNKK
jgi:uncharacterized protein YdhG (YjbR/CyaY superfamily)